MISEIHAGERLSEIVIVRVQKIGQSSNGAPFARGLIEDNSGCLPFICFEKSVIEVLRGILAPQALSIVGMVDINKYASDMSLQLLLQKAQAVPEQADLTHLLPQQNLDLQALQEEALALVASIESAELRKLVELVLDENTLKRFCLNPAGMRLHHAYIGGLLQHSVSVARLALALGREAGGVDLDLLKAGGLLHDIGKLQEISAELGFPYTHQGRLLGHISMGAMLLRRKALEVPELPASKLEALLHIILSHHGEVDKGSPVPCATKEAFMVHHADELDAVLNQFQGAKAGDGWEFNKMLQRFIYDPA